MCRITYINIVSNHSKFTIEKQLLKKRNKVMQSTLKGKFPIPPNLMKDCPIPPKNVYKPKKPVY